MCYDKECLHILLIFNHFSQVTSAIDRCWLRQGAVPCSNSLKGEQSMENKKIVLLLCFVSGLHYLCMLEII